MANWNEPTVNTDYTTFPTKVREVAISAASMEYGSDSNIPDGVFKYDRTTKQFYQRESGFWVAKEITGLADDAVGTDAIQDESVTSGKLSPEAASRRTLLFEGWQHITSGSAGYAYRRTSVDPGGAQYVTEITLPIGCIVTQLSWNSNVAKTGGSAELYVYKNGVSTGQFLTINDSDSSSGQTVSPVEFTAGQKLSLILSQSSMVISGTAITTAQAWGIFTE